ncbi:MAG: hypothetical protein PHO79_07010 [Desulfoplanes sp.]|nr:hypothetical protein [Desulfoplanes sp.]MDD4649746.1 hypothetical protein [Desulfoplanes sp.]
MDLERATTQATLIGQDFLTWLWATSEQHRGRFTTASGEDFSLFVEQRVSVQGGEGEGKETAVCSGPMAELKEARMGLRTGKKVGQAKLRIEHDENAWQVQINADTFALSGLKTPKVDTHVEEGDDPDAIFLEKIFLIEKCMLYLDTVFSIFIKLRMSSQWNSEIERIRQWMNAA